MLVSCVGRHALQQPTTNKGRCRAAHADGAGLGEAGCRDQELRKLTLQHATTPATPLKHTRHGTNHQRYRCTACAAAKTTHTHGTFRKHRPSTCCDMCAGAATAQPSRCHHSSSMPHSTRRAHPNDITQREANHGCGRVCTTNSSSPTKQPSTSCAPPKLCSMQLATAAMRRPSATRASPDWLRGWRE